VKSVASLLISLTAISNIVASHLRCEWLGGACLRRLLPQILFLEPIMKPLLLVGVVILILGILSFVVPFPHMHHHGVSVGDAHIGVTTEHDEKIPPAVSVVLVVVGAGLLLTGRKD
jgi:hypothetical protein